MVSRSIYRQGGKARKMKEEIYTKNAPEPVGPYSQAVQAGQTIYLSGQIGIDPKTGNLLVGALEDEIKQVFENITQVLKAAGATVHDVVRADIFMKDIGQFGLVNGIYETWLTGVEIKPARQTVEVSMLPKGARIEVSCVAHKG
jgi:2-iminobutanoate/2-iminopropanoate deaminase